MEEPMNKLRESRQALGWSRDKMAAELGMSKRNIENWESGRNTPPEWVLQLLFEKFERLLTEDESPGIVICREKVSTSPVIYKESIIMSAPLKMCREFCEKNRSATMEYRIEAAAGGGSEFDPKSMISECECDLYEKDAETGEFKKVRGFRSDRLLKYFSGFKK